MPDSFLLQRDGVRLVGDRWPGEGPTVVLLHAGVCDRRCWSEVAEAIVPGAAVVAYDRRGHGDTVPSTGAFRHVDDLFAVVDEVAGGPVWLVGSSAGGMVALDAALEAPERVAGLVLLAPAVSGAPEPAWDPATLSLGDRIDAALAAGDLDEANRLEAWVWLDGPREPEGRVRGGGRSLLLEMNRTIIANEVEELHDGASGLDTWSRLEDIRAPATVACGDLDVPFLVARAAEIARRLPLGRHVAVPGRGHLPYLEDPIETAALIAEALARPTAGGA